MRIDLPSTFRNPISLIGVAIATSMAIVFAMLLALEMAGQLTNPYIGLLIYVAGPAVFMVGTVLMLIGAVRQRRRAAAGKTDPGWPVIDMRLPRTRAVIFGVAMITCVNILIVSLAAYGTVHHMESAEFCGTTCHTTMEPEWRAYNAFPHARVACIECHVGSGAGALVQSKIKGSRQLWHVISNQVTKPVPSPVRSMRPARQTCQACHWDERAHGDKLRVIREYSDDDKGTETATTLQLHVGGGRASLGLGSGIHWHMNIDNTVEFIATDDRRQTIPWVKFTERNGTVTEYTIERAVDNSITAGELPRTLPLSRREAVAALKDEYQTSDVALRGIESRLRKVYASQANDPALARTVAAVQSIYRENVFPSMKVGWGSYPNNIGHVFFNGCFRCHDDNHKSSDGATIKQDCETCHAMP
jgi:hypothetical protein